MSKIAFSLQNQNLKKQQGFYSVGLPCPRGRFSISDPLILVGKNGEHVNAAINVNSLWQDGSVKWIYVSGITSLKPKEIYDYTIEIGAKTQPQFKNPIEVVYAPFREATVKKDSAQPQTVSINIKLNNERTVTFHRNTPLHISFGGEFSASLIHYGNDKYHLVSDFKPIQFNYEVQRSSHKNIAVKVTQTGQFTLQDKPIIVEHETTIYLQNGETISNITFTNPSAALHPNGQWDLGDKSSVYINELAIAIDKKATKVNATDELVIDGSFDTLDIDQASSGKTNWQSPVHVNASGRVNLPYKGAKVRVNGEVQHSLYQCQPQATLLLENDSTYILEAKEFWQHFPSTLRVQNEFTSVSLLGAKHSEPQELQPGEQLTRQITLSPQRLVEFHVILNTDWIKQSSSLPFTPFTAPKQLQNLVKKGIKGDNSFFHKRDAIDEYGWRHFGELYADHEKALAPDTPFFVSHYNNQYDPLCGMLYQWAVSGDQRWKELADNLAKHVANIDVYHTTLDKPEYSGGLFWHTDHYVPAHTAGHRTYSKNQPSNVYEDHAGGGGPGGQHCYTNGLLHHYLFTGSTTSKQALLKICSWIESYYEGDGTLLSALLLLKNTGTEGLKNLKTGQYPLDRGTGNYLQALMDRYALLNNISDLEKCAHIIQHTVSPADDITQRQLDNVEATWFYTVFFQAVCRFIQLKETLNQSDYAYAYAVNVLKHYVIHILEHEYVYLDKPDILEFPNETWTGQDLRKLCLLAFAKAYMRDAEQALEQKKQYLQQQIIDRLCNTKESETTRLLCLMMQNMNFDAYEQAPKPNHDFLNSYNSVLFKEHTESLAKFAIKTLKGFSLGRERSQAVKRISKLQKWLGEP